jgi:hypothetical protein
MITEFNTEYNVWEARITGTGFAGDANSVLLKIKGVEQNAVTVTETEAVFEIIDIDGPAQTDIKMYFDIGLPAGGEIL